MCTNESPKVRTCDPYHDFCRTQDFCTPRDACLPTGANTRPLHQCMASIAPPSIQPIKRTRDVFEEAEIVIGVRYHRPRDHPELHALLPSSCYVQLRREHFKIQKRSERSRSTLCFSKSILLRRRRYIDVERDGRTGLC